MKRMRQSFKYSGILLWLMLLLPSLIVRAQSVDVEFPSQERVQRPAGTQTLDNPLGFDSISLFFAKMLDVVIQISFPIIVLALVYTGFLFVSAQGNEEKLTKAKTYFLWTVVGAVIILGASVILNAIEGTVTEIRRGAVAPPSGIERV